MNGQFTILRDGTVLYGYVQPGENHIVTDETLLLYLDLTIDKYFLPGQGRFPKVISRNKHRDRYLAINEDQLEVDYHETVDKYIPLQEIVVDKAMPITMKEAFTIRIEGVNHSLRVQKTINIHCMVLEIIET